MISRSRLILTAIGVASFASLVTWTAHGKITTQGELADFTHETIETQFKNGQVTGTTSTVYAMRRDGSYALVAKLRAPNGEFYERHDIMDLENLKRSMSHTGIDVVSTIPVSPQFAKNLRATHKGQCGGGKEAERMSIQGYEVVRSQAPPVPMGSNQVLIAEQWVAPSLACVPLRVVWRIDGQIVLSRETKEIREGTPPQALFQAPPHFEEVSPGEAARRFSQRFGGGAYNPDGRVEKEVEDSYLRARGEVGWH